VAGTGRPPTRRSSRWALIDAAVEAYLGRGMQRGLLPRPTGCERVRPGSADKKNHARASRRRVGHDDVDWLLGRIRELVLALAWAPVILLSVVATGNHFLVGVIAGVASRSSGLA
jgi:hypothetical protein